MTAEDLIADFRDLEDWEDRYRYVIELGKALPALPESERTDANKVRGCASQVWLVSRRDGGMMEFRGDSDAHIVRGLMAILLGLYSGKPASEIAASDPDAIFSQLGLREHLTAQRSNGLSAMVNRMKADAQAAAAAA